MLSILGLSLALSLTTNNSVAKDQQVTNLSAKATSYPALAAAAKEEAKPKGATVALKGEWDSGCVPTDDDDSALTNAKSMKSLLTFDGKDKSTMKVSYYLDAKCATPYTQAQADAAIKSYETKNKTKVDDEIKKIFTEMVQASAETTPYKASEVADSQVGTLDATTEGEADFSSYKIVGDKLYITESCLPADIAEHKESGSTKPACKLSGESAAHRSTSFDNALTYTRIK